MKLPNLSYMVKVGQLRTIQALYEQPEHRNPDDVARQFLPMGERLGCTLRGRFFLGRMRSQPFYPYVLARTRYYDQVFLDAIEQGVQFIVNIGCGSDTRAYRFRQRLAAKGIGVVECDQADAIRVKQEIATRKTGTIGAVGHVEYLPIDLNDEAWPPLQRWLKAHAGAKLLVMLEGVSPYVQTTRFDAFLRHLGRDLAPGSLLAYDFKRTDTLPDFGRSERTREPFRLPVDREAAARFHAERGLRLDAFETCVELQDRLAPGLARQARSRFDEDCLLRLTVTGTA